MRLPIGCRSAVSSRALRGWLRRFLKVFRPRGVRRGGCDWLFRARDSPASPFRAVRGRGQRFRFVIGRERPLAPRSASRLVERHFVPPPRGPQQPHFRPSLCPQAGSGSSGDCTVRAVPRPEAAEPNPRPSESDRTDPAARCLLREGQGGCKRE